MEPSQASGEKLTHRAELTWHSVLRTSNEYEVWFRRVGRAGQEKVAEITKHGN